MSLDCWRLEIFFKFFWHFLWKLIYHGGSDIATGIQKVGCALASALYTKISVACNPLVWALFAKKNFEAHYFSYSGAMEKPDKEHNKKPNNSTCLGSGLAQGWWLSSPERPSWPSGPLLFRMTRVRTPPAGGCFCVCMIRCCRSWDYHGWILRILCPVWTAPETWNTREEEQQLISPRRKRQPAGHNLSQRFCILVWDVNVELFSVCSHGADAVQFGYYFNQVIAAEQEVTFDSRSWALLGATLNLETIFLHLFEKDFVATKQPEKVYHLSLHIKTMFSSPLWVWEQRSHRFACSLTHLQGL